jgi:RNA polymerase sigma-70 factor (ECF subfamily)
MAAEDVQLAAEFARGERRAVETVDVWLARAAAPFRRRLGADWEDVLQEVRIEVLRLVGRGAFRGESSLKTYLWQVTAHTCIDALRRRQRRPLTDALEIDDTPLPSSDPSPLDRVLARESSQALLAVLEAMSSECRELWDLILAGLSYRDISARLGVSEGALRVRALRCRRRAAEVAGRNVVAEKAPHE